ncbi:hypothetical protein V8E54_003113 [Elaphomyces granulatus]
MESTTTNLESPIPSLPRPQAFREACEECHRRKIRCVSNNGACQYCVLSGRDCIFRPRSVMGRPRKSPKAGGSRGALSDSANTPPATGESEHQYKKNRRPRQQHRQQQQQQQQHHHHHHHHHHRKQGEEECTASVLTLFSLGRLGDQLSLKDPAAVLSGDILQDIFKQVSAFCESIPPGIKAVDFRMSPNNETQSMVQLVIMTISSVLNLYSTLVQNSDILLTGLPQIESITGANHSNDIITNNAITAMAMPLTQFTEPDIGLWNSGNVNDVFGGMNSRLTVVLHLTVIDYHITQLQYIISNFSYKIGEQMLAMYASTIEELKKNHMWAEELRAKIETLNEKLKQHA